MILIMASFNLFISCTPSKAKIIGIYIAKKQENSIDSLYLFENNYYKHSIHSKKDNNHIHTQYNTWDYSEGFIDLNKFYDNDDKMYDENKNYSFSEGYMLINTPVNSIFNKVTIDINSDMGNLYEKILSDESGIYIKEYKRLMSNSSK